MTLGVLGSGMATSRGTDLLSNAATEVDTNCTGLSSGSSCNVSGALAAPGLFILFFFFLSTTILHSPPSCPLGGDDNWVALPAAVVAFLGRVSQLCRPSCRRSSRRCRCSLAKARASQIFSRGRKDSPSRPPPPPLTSSFLGGPALKWKRCTVHSSDDRKWPFRFALSDGLRSPSPAPSHVSPPA